MSVSVCVCVCVCVCTCVCVHVCVCACVHVCPHNQTGKVAQQPQDEIDEGGTEKERCTEDIPEVF